MNQETIERTLDAIDEAKRELIRIDPHPSVRADIDRAYPHHFSLLLLLARASDEGEKAPQSDCVPFDHSTNAAYRKIAKANGTHRTLIAYARKICSITHPQHAEDLLQVSNGRSVQILVHVVAIAFLAHWMAHRLSACWTVCARKDAS